MRIIAGLRRGHKFAGPKGSEIRPTSELVRESLFNILGSAVEDRLLIDLFAGTGSLGLEGLSRGAGRAIFVERDRVHAELIRRKVETLRFESRARVVMGDAYRFVRGFRPAANEPVIVVIDPPYREFEGRARRISRLLEELLPALPAESIVAVESRRALERQALPDPDLWDIRRYGGTQLAIRTISDRADAGAAVVEEGGESSDAAG
jgi:16S rRNA (guanine966-N2)-methyltransferase